MTSLLHIPAKHTLTLPPQEWATWFAGLHTAHALSYSEDVRLARVQTLIETHYNESLDLDTMARCAFMSRYHFLRSFRRMYGTTPHKYLTHRRIQEAQRLLKETNRSITDVCFEVGFQSLGSFSTLFRKYTGRSPSQYRAFYIHIPWSPRRKHCSWIPTCFFQAFSSVPFRFPTQSSA